MTKTRAEMQLRPDGDYDEDVAAVEQVLNRHMPNTHTVRPKPDRRLLIERLTNEELQDIIYLFDLSGHVPWDDLRYTRAALPQAA